MTPLPQDHASFGAPMRHSSKLTSVTMPMVADTGCQSMIIPLQSAYAMGIRRQDFIPVKLTMRGAIKKDLGVIGGVVVDITTQNPSGPNRSTRQLCYVSDRMEKAFLCREALIALGIISPEFPIVVATASSDTITSPATSDDITCSCPRRIQEPPPIPTALPQGLPAVEDNVEALKEWLLNYYGLLHSTCVSISHCHS